MRSLLASRRGIDTGLSPIRVPLPIRNYRGHVPALPIRPSMPLGMRGNAHAPGSRLQLHALPYRAVSAHRVDSYGIECFQRAAFRFKALASVSVGLRLALAFAGLARSHKVG